MRHPAADRDPPRATTLLRSLIWLQICRHWRIVSVILICACVSQTYFWTRFPRSPSVCTHTAVIRKSKPERVKMGYSHRVAHSSAFQINILLSTRRRVNSRSSGSVRLQHSLLTRKPNSGMDEEWSLLLDPEFVARGKGSSYVQFPFRTPVLGVREKFYISVDFIVVVFTLFKQGRLTSHGSIQM